MKKLNLVFVICLYLSQQTFSRIIFTDGNKLVHSEPKDELEMKLKQKDEGNIIWTKVETKTGSAIPSSQDGNNSDSEEKIIPKASAELLEHQAREDSENLTIAKVNETWIENWEPLDTRSQFPENNSIKDSASFLGNHSQDMNFSNSSELSDVLFAGNLSSFVLEFENQNISDAIISFDDLNEESTLAERLIDSMHPLEHKTFNDAFLIFDDDASLFQEVSTFGFEFLIDSETTRNSFLSELLISQNMSVSDVSEELSILLRDWENSSLESENSIGGQGINFNSLNESLVLLSTEADIEDFGSENINVRDFNITGSEQNTVTQITPVCPDPGWCFFWLFAEDTCAEDHHCLSSRICCKLGCAKTCIDV